MPSSIWCHALCNYHDEAIELLKVQRYIRKSKNTKVQNGGLISDDGSNQRMVRVVERALIAIAKPVNGPPQ